jgi:hypothetical protein
MKTYVKKELQIPNIVCTNGVYKTIKKAWDGAKLGSRITNVVRIYENVECIVSQSSPVVSFCAYVDATWIIKK